MNVTLHKQLVDACNLLNNAMSYENRIAVLEGEIEKYESKYQQMKKRGFSSAPGVLTIIFLGGFLAVIVAAIILVVAVGAYIHKIEPELSPQFILELLNGFYLGQPNLEFLERINFATVETIIFCVVTAAIILVPGLLILFSQLYRNTYCKAKTKALQKEAQQYWDGVGAPACEKIRAQVRALRQEQKDYVRKNFDLISFVPDAYRNPRVVPFLEQVVRNGRADSLKEAINLYEEQLHRWALEDQARRIAEEAEWQSYNVRRQLLELQELQEKIKY